MKKQKRERSTVELLKEVEAEIKRLRAVNQRLAAELAAARGDKSPVRRPALGKGLSQLFGGPKNG